MPIDTTSFDVLILVGRPASGKSEIIDFLTRLPENVRRRRYHVEALDILDDFPMLWTWFEEDEILSSRMGQARLYTDKDGYFKHPSLWQLLIERLNLEYQKRRRDHPGYHAHTTTLVEFSRGKEAGGYREAFSHLADDLLCRAVVLYVNVSYAESLRKNRARFNPERPDSILEHGLSDEKMERIYKEDDWAQFATGSSGTLEIKGRRVPFAVFENEDDVTTGHKELLAGRLEKALNALWEMYEQCDPA